MKRTSLNKSLRWSKRGPLSFRSSKSRARWCTGCLHPTTTRAGSSMWELTMGLASHLRPSTKAASIKPQGLLLRGCLIIVTQEALISLWRTHLTSINEQSTTIPLHLTAMPRHSSSNSNSNTRSLTPSPMAPLLRISSRPRPLILLSRISAKAVTPSLCQPLLHSPELRLLITRCLSTSIPISISSKRGPSCWTMNPPISKLNLITRNKYRVIILTSSCKRTNNTLRMLKKIWTILRCLTTTMKMMRMKMSSMRRKPWVLHLARAWLAWFSPLRLSPLKAPTEWRTSTG